jgi:hypothetical protein
MTEATQNTVEATEVPATETAVVAATETPATPAVEETEGKLSFRQRIDIYLDALEKKGEMLDGRPIFAIKSGVTKSQLQKSMKTTEAGINGVLPKIKKYLQYGSTVWNYKGEQLVGVDESEPCLQAKLNKQVTDFIKFVDDDMKKPADERLLSVVEPGVEFPDFTGSRSAKKTPQLGGIMNRLKSLSAK